MKNGTTVVLPASEVVLLLLMLEIPPADQHRDSGTHGPVSRYPVHELPVHTPIRQSG